MSYAPMTYNEAKRMVFESIIVMHCQICCKPVVVQRAAWWVIMACGPCLKQHRFGYVANQTYTLGTGQPHQLLCL